MVEQQNLEHIFTICRTLPLDKQAELIKQLLGDSNLLSYLLNVFGKEQIAVMLRAIADYIASETR